MPTDTFSIAGTNDDGTGYYEDASWPPDGGSWNDGESGNRIFAFKGLDGNYFAQVGCMRWDTSSIGTGQVVTAASLFLHCGDRTDGANDYDLVADYYDFGGEPTVGADWVETADPSIITPIDLSSISVPAVNEFVLNDLSGINMTGFTGIRITLSAGTPTVALNYAGFAAFEHATQPEAQLEVTWEAATPATPAFIPARRRGR
jgi:hypothetical protein